MRCHDQFHTDVFLLNTIVNARIGVYVSIPQHLRPPATEIHTRALCCPMNMTDNKMTNKKFWKKIFESEKVVYDWKISWPIYTAVPVEWS